MKKVVCFGEIMLRLATPRFERFTQASSFDASFGGGEANVAVSLAHFGMNACFVSRLPANDIGQACLMTLHKHGVQTSHILRGGTRMGIYFLETGAVARPSQVIYDRADSAFSVVTPGMFPWEEIFSGASLFHWTGITPALSRGAADTCLEAIRVAGDMGLTISCDLNYRKNLWKYGEKASEVMPALVKGCDIVLGNEEDVEMVLGIKPRGVDVSSGRVEAEPYGEVSRQIIARFPRVKMVVTTLRGSLSASHNTWSGILYDGKELYRCPSYDISPVVDRVGGGDSFMAGLIYALLTRPGDPSWALHFGCAASCLKHTIHGDFNLVTVAEVEKLMSGDSSGRISR